VVTVLSCGAAAVFGASLLSRRLTNSRMPLVSSYMRASCILDDCTLLLLDRHKHQWED
jgi:hypothetical protein